MIRDDRQERMPLHGDWSIRTSSKRGNPRPTRQPGSLAKGGGRHATPPTPSVTHVLKQKDRFLQGAARCSGTPKATQASPQDWVLYPSGSC